MSTPVSLLNRYENREISEILHDLYRQTLGSLPPAGASDVFLLLSIYGFHQQLLLNMPGSVFWIDKNDRYLGCNKTVLDVLGFHTQEELLGLTSKEVGKLLKWSPEQTKDILADNKKLFATGDSIVNKQEMPFDDMHGHTWIQYTNKVPIKNKEGDPELLLGISLDVSDRIKHMDEVKNQRNTLEAILHDLHKEILGRPPPEGEDPRQLFSRICHFHKSILDNMPGCVYWVDSEDKMIGCNKNTLDMLGLTEKQIARKTTKDIAAILHLSEQHLASMLADNKTVFTTGKPVINKQEEPFTDMQGNHWVQLTNKVPIKNDNDDTDFLLGVSLDISDRIKLIEELAEQKERAETASQAKTSFLENMRHDIRTPLSGMLGCCDMILQSPNDNKTVIKSAESIRAATNSLLHFMNRMLEMTRVADGKISNRVDRFATKAPINRILDLLHPAASIKKISLTLNYDNNIPEIVCCNLDRFFKIFYEPLKNAIMFTNESGLVNLSVTLLKTEQDTALIQVDIKDTGIGMTEDQVRKIFTPFTKAIPSYRGHHEGIGIGLTVAKQFVDDLNGEIYVANSTEGKGTIIRINLPLKLPLTNDHEGLVTDFNYLQESVIELAPDVPSTHCKILIVEDNTMASKIVENILTQLKFTVHIAANGNTALSLANTNHYELIFMDIGLPDIDGCEVTRRIREIEKTTNRHVPIIGLTAHVDVENHQHCIKAGMEEVLQKPLEPEKANDILHRFIPHVYMNNSTTESSTEANFQSKTKNREPIIDIEQCRLLVGGSEKIAHEIITMLIKSFEIELPAITAAHDNNDWNILHALVHKLKSSACYTGTPYLLAACTALESAIYNKKIDAYSHLYSQICHEIERCKTAYQKIYPQGLSNI